MQTDGNDETVYLGFSTTPGGPVSAWSATVPNPFTVSPAMDSFSDIAVSSDGT